MPKISSWRQHVARWRDCRECELCSNRKNIVLARGIIPADVVFVGEAPGPSEDVLGSPFVGPAGKLLDRLISEAGWNVSDHGVSPVRYAFTNLVACIPKDDQGSKWGEPPKDAILSCAPRLRDFIEVCRPKLIVAVGQLAEKWLPKILEQLDDPKNGPDRPRQSAVGGALQGKIPGALQRRVALRAVPSVPTSRRYRLGAIIHPAAILRADITQQGLVIQRTIVTLRDLLEELS